MLDGLLYLKRACVAGGSGKLVRCWGVAQEERMKCRLLSGAQSETLFNLASFPGWSAKLRPDRLKHKSRSMGTVIIYMYQ